MRNYFVVFMCLLCLHSQAQKMFRFTSQNTVGLLEGSNGSSFQLTTINGISNNKVFAGIGTGLDYYYIRSIPVFLSLQTDLTAKARTPFFTLDGGLNYAWTKKERTRWNDFLTADFKAKLYWAGGLGYKVGLKNGKDALLLNIGYSYKHLQEVQTKAVFCINPPCPPSTVVYNYKLNRLFVRFGWQL